MSPENNHGINPTLSSQTTEEELAQVYSRQLPRLVSIARNRGARDAEDVAQDSVLQAIMMLRRGGYEERGRLTQYLGVIVQNRAISLSRRKSVNRVSLAEFQEFIVNETAEGQPERAVIGREDLAEVEEAIGNLPPRQRDVLILWSRGLTHQEISSQLDINPNNSKVYLSKARKRLKSLL